MRSELAFTLRLGAPLALGELGWMSTYIVDALMIGRLPATYSPLAQSAALLGNTIFYAIVFSAIWLMNGLETLISQAFGEGEQDECLYLLAQSGYIVLICTPFVIATTLGFVALLPHFGTPPAIVTETFRYTRPLVLSTPFLMAYMALRRFLQSMNNVIWVTVSLLTASLVNWLGDWALLFGHLGFKPQGIAGSAWATLVVRLYMLGLLGAGAIVVSKKWRLSFKPSMIVPNVPRLRALLTLGVPSSIESLAEFGVSTYMSVLCTRLGVILAAAQDVVLNLNAFVYQVPVGLSYATVTRVGQAAGRDSRDQVQRATNASLLLGVGFILVAGLVFAVFARFWASLYSSNAEVVTAAVPIFTLCAFLLLGDTTFVMLASALTGLGDTRTPMIVSLIWNWGIGMPLGYILAFHHGFALKGLWFGRATASVGTGITLLAYWQWRMRRAAADPQHASLNVIRTVVATNDLALNKVHAPTIF